MRRRKRALGRGAQDEVGRAADAQQAPQHGLAGATAAVHGGLPPAHRSVRHRVRQSHVEILHSWGPSRSQPLPERVALRAREVGRPQWQIRQLTGPTTCSVGPARIPCPRSPALHAASASTVPSPGSAGAPPPPPDRVATEGLLTPDRPRRNSAFTALRRLPDRRIQSLVLGRRHLGVPVASTGQNPATTGTTTRATTGTALPSDQQGVEHGGRRHVEQDVREVLAAHQIDVVHPQVDRRHLVARSAPGALPLDDLGQPAAQAVVGGQESTAVLPRRVELRVERTTSAQPRQVLPHLGRQAVHYRRTGVNRLVDVRQSQHAQPRPELGHGGPVARHPASLARRLCADPDPWQTRPGPRRHHGRHARELPGPPGTNRILSRRTAV